MARAITYVRQDMLAPQPAPISQGTVTGWIRTNLLATPKDVVLTFIAVALLLWTVPGIINWLFIQASWVGSDRSVCATIPQGGIQPEGWSGACWAFVEERFGQFIFGRYPLEERWRPMLVGILFIALLIPMLIPARKSSTDTKNLQSYQTVLSRFGKFGSYWVLVNSILTLLFPRQLSSSFWLRLAPFGIVYVLLILPYCAFLLTHSMRDRKGLNALLLFVIFPVVAFFLLHGGFGLETVETPLWGGLMVTLVLSFVGIAVSLPLGILLALGRRSKLPVIKMLCITFIEVVRGVPLITVLFMANVMLPLFLPTGWTIDNFLRALVGVALFASAYMAEVIRGGLQAIPKGQYEGADSLGLGYWQTTRLIILPQAIKLVIPGIVNTFIGLFKDTSLVSIIGMFDLLGIVQLNFRDANWITPVTPITGLIFAGFLFWLFCFGMSRYSAFMERHLDTGHKR